MRPDRGTSYDASVRLEVRTADETRTIGRLLGRILVAGDLVLLTGGLGAGKTTFAQGIGAGLQVRGDVTSPTFVISRVHPPLAAGPAMVHVDAYRLGGLAELDDLDLDETLELAVTVVEWGEGLADRLSLSRLHVTLERQRGDLGLGAEDEPRLLALRPVGPRWAGVDLARALAAEPS